MEYPLCMLKTGRSRATLYGIPGHSFPILKMMTVQWDPERGEVLGSQDPNATI